jgi:hypothetical protein
MLPVIRLLIGIASVAALLGGLVLLITGPVGTAVATFWLLVMGGVGLVAVAFERMRYRSGSAERTSDPSGPERGPLEPRFRPTDERFVDPTTREQLRVWVDPASGERRYRPDA